MNTMEQNGQPRRGKPGDQLLRLKFQPNPKYDPNARRAGFGRNAGVVLIDPQKAHRKIDGTLFKDVSFGWGILGHLDRGGHFQVISRCWRQQFGLLPAWFAFNRQGSPIQIHQYQIH